jgi:hypothetical protein
MLPVHACLPWFINMYGKEDGNGIDLTGWEDQPEPADIFHLMHPSHLYMRHHWPKHFQGADDYEQTSLSSLLKFFLGSPDESSKQYQKWYEVTANDLQEIITVADLQGIDIYKFYLEVAGFNKEGFDTCDFNQAPHPEYGEFESELGPSNVAILAMCHLAFSAIVSD